jgi:hypothetical protein
MRDHMPQVYPRYVRTKFRQTKTTVKSTIATILNNWIHQKVLILAV